MNKEECRVPVEKLRHSCDQAAFKFSQTTELEPLKDFIGQDGAIEAIRLGLEIDSLGYNIFATGLSGTGRTAVIKENLKGFAEEKKAQGGAFLRDLCFVRNQANPDRPKLLTFEKGKGRKFQKEIDGCLSDLKNKISTEFTSNGYLEEKNQIHEEYGKKHEELNDELKKTAQKEDIIIVPTQMGPQPVPRSLTEERPLSQEEFERFPEEAQERLKESQKSIISLMERTYQKHQQLDKEMKEKIKELEKKVAEKVLRSVLGELESDYQNSPEVVQYLNSLREHVLNYLDVFIPQENNNHQQAASPFHLYYQKGREITAFLPFQVNVFLDNSQKEEPPVIIENNPTFSNLFGRIEKSYSEGTYSTDHTLLRPGSLSLADGGYLVLNSRDALINPGVWGKLQKTLKTGYLKLEESYEYLGLPVTMSLKPQEIPIRVKVILIGEPMLYDALCYYDEDFLTNFKVKAEFDYEMDLTKENLLSYAGFVAFCCGKEGLLPLDRAAVVKVAEEGMRLVSSQKKLSTKFSRIKNLIVEADYWARKAGAPLVLSEHVQKAIIKKQQRSDLRSRKIEEVIKDGIFLIDVEGKKTEQINGLAVYQLGDISFGKPFRITAKTFLGKPGLISVEREVKLSGPIKEKGVLILGGCLAARYAQEIPLSLSISLCSEQSYGPVEGDSASAAELFVILSSLSGLPIDQGIAVTGSINQHGEIQPIGGVNEKIEGWFDTCKIKGLSGEQGMIIPHQNIQHLMLREDIVQAVVENQFSIYAIKSIEEGIEILTGESMNDIDQKIKKRLKDMAEASQKFKKGE